MEYRQLGASGLRVPVLSLGTATWGGATEGFRVWGATDVREAKRMVDLCLDSGANFFDTANVYSYGLAEKILGAALAGRRDKALIATKAGSNMGDGPNECGSSRRHLIKECEDSLARLGVDHIDIYYIHEFDATTPVEETLSALDALVSSGKVRYIGCSNFSGWHLMKSLAISEKYGWARYVAHQAHYSLAAREYEWELMPLALDQKVATVVYSALGGAALTGKIRRNQPLPENSRLSKDLYGTAPSEFIYKIVDVLDQLAEETGKTISQIAINWLLNRPTVSNVIIGARTEDQLKENLGAAGWLLSEEQISKLDSVSEKTQIYPYSHQRYFPLINPSPLTRR